MGEKLIVGLKFGGLVNAIEPFAVDNESFPFLLNAFEWRGRIRRKRGTSLLTRLQAYFDSTNLTYNSSGDSIILDSNGQGNLFESYGFVASSSIVPGSVIITDTTTSTTYTDPASNGLLVGSPSGVGAINYMTGVIGIVGGAGNTIESIFSYYPGLPVMGVRQLNLTSSQFPGTLGFDTELAYNITPTVPSTSYNVSFYANPATGTYSGYTQKTNVSPLNWNSQNYQLIWSVNYQNSLWATNGITVPFNTTNIGMQFKPIVTVTVTGATTAELQITAHGLVVGDFVFVNEVVTTTGINFHTGFVTTVVDTNHVIVTFPNATIATNGTGGIAQYLTSSANPTKDCIRWYDGDPTNGNSTTPVLNGHLGWVNFMPPLSQLPYTIGDLPAQIYYLVGARLIVPFKDRLLFFGPVVQSSTSAAQYLQDTILWSQVGTAFYTASFPGDISTIPPPTFTPILTPGIEVAAPNAYFEDVTGFGGYLTAGYEQPITTVSPNEDVLILGFSTRQARLIYSGNDILPFNLFIINSELGSSSTFSTINLDRGVLTIGEHGLIDTSQIGAERFDIDIPDEIFQFNLLNNGAQRVTAQRDFINEFIYFTYCSNNSGGNTLYIFPNRTLQYNYREKTWAIFDESYTCYGQFRHVDGLTWATVGLKYPTWESWTEPWSSGASTLLQPKVIGGNSQGFVLERDDGTDEGISLSIQNISFPSAITGATNANPLVITTNNNYIPGQTVMITGVVGMTQLNGNSYVVSSATPTTVTLIVNSTGFGTYISGGFAIPSVPIYSPHHTLNSGDYIVVSGVLGSLGIQLNGNIFSIYNPTEDGFFLNPPITAAGPYIGVGVIKRMYVPVIQSKQFNPSWGMGRKTRIGVQQYLLSTTSNGQITLLIYLSQNAIGKGEAGYNQPPIIPAPGSFNDGLIYSTVLYTCPESTNLGLTPANTNLQMVTAQYQNQIWHRINTSLIGDTVQVGFTLSDAQMRDTTFSNQFVEIELHCMVIDMNPSQLLA